MRTLLVLLLCPFWCCAAGLTPAFLSSIHVTAEAPAAGGSPAWTGVGRGTNTGSGTTTTLASFPVSGANKLLVVGVVVGGGSSSSISWNGSTSGWVLARRTNYWDASTLSTELWYLVNPADATANIVSTHDNTDVAMCAALITNVNQTTPIYATNANFITPAKNGSTNTISCEVGNLVVDFVTSQTDGLVPLQTQIAVSHTGNYAYMSASNTTATSATMIDDFPGSDTSTFGWVAIAIKGP